MKKVGNIINTIKKFNFCSLWLYSLGGDVVWDKFVSSFTMLYLKLKSSYPIDIFWCVDFRQICGLIKNSIHFTPFHFKFLLINFTNWSLYLWHETVSVVCRRNPYKVWHKNTEESVLYYIRKYHSHLTLLHNNYALPFRSAYGFWGSKSQNSELCSAQTS